jgi:hypothetical protein
MPPPAHQTLKELQRTADSFVEDSAEARLALQEVRALGVPCVFVAR